jgi:Domain of Unknown Function (DUF1206)
MTEVHAQQVIREHPEITMIGRVGWFAKGLVYLVAGILALMVALRSIGLKKPGNSGEASPTGAINEVAHHNFGGLVLIILAVGMIIYAGWRLLSAAMPGSHETKVVVVRIAYVISAIMYATFAFTAFKVLLQKTTTDGNSKVTDLSQSIMRHSGGRVLIGVVGAVLIGAAVYRINKGRKEDVTQELDMSGMSSERQVWTRRLGAVGEIGRGVALLLIGFFLLRAAATYDAKEATGLDGALRKAAENGWSRILVILVAIGFVCYGLFCLSTFTRRRFEAPR